MRNQSVATMSFKDLESLIHEIIERKLNNMKLKKQDDLGKTEIVKQIDNLRQKINAQYGDFPNSIDLLQEDRIR